MKSIGGSAKRRVLLASRAIESSASEGGFVLLRDLAQGLSGSVDFWPAVFSVHSTQSGAIERLKTFRAPEWNRLRSIEFLFGLLHYQSRFEIVHTAHVPTWMNTRMLRSVAVYGRRHGAQYVQTVTALDVDAAVGSKTLLWGDHVVAQSPAVYRSLRSCVPKLSLIAPWPSPSRVAFDPGRRQTTRAALLGECSRIVVFPGEFHRIGLDESVIACIATLLRRDRGALFVLACRFDERGLGGRIFDACNREFPRRIYNLGYTGSIIEVLEAADLVVYPARRMKGKFHPPLVLTEAMALGTPVLTSDNIELPAAGRPGVMQCPVDDMSTFGQAAASILLDERPRVPVQPGRFEDMMRAYERCYVGHETECF